MSEPLGSLCNLNLQLAATQQASLLPWPRPRRSRVGSDLVGRPLVGLAGPPELQRLAQVDHWSRPSAVSMADKGCTQRESPLLQAPSSGSVALGRPDCGSAHWAAHCRLALLCSRLVPNQPQLSLAPQSCPLRPPTLHLRPLPTSHWLAPVCEAWKFSFFVRKIGDVLRSLQMRGSRRRRRSKEEMEVLPILGWQADLASGRCCASGE